MERLTIWFAFLGFQLSVSAQNFHFVYIRVDNSMEMNLLKEQISSLKDIFEVGDFVLYYSNSPTVMDAGSYDERELFGLIGEQMSSYDITTPDEIEAISGLLEKYLQTEFDGSGRLVSPRYTRLTFDFIVGKDFLDKYCQDEVLARSILINSLMDFDMRINFYPSGADYSSVEFEPLYNIKHKINVKSL